MRRVVAAVIVAGLGLAACGSPSPSATTSGSSSSPSSSATSSTSASTTSTAPGTAQANAVAAAVNIKASDVPGFSGSPHTQSAQDQQSSDEVARCAGATPPSKAVADIYSDDFTQGSGTQTKVVSSDVTAMPSADLVRTDLAAIRSAKAQQCFIQFARSQLSQSAGSGVQINNVTVQSLPAEAPGTEGGFGYRFVVSATTQGTPFTVYIDLLGFAQGNYEVELNAFAIGQTFPSSTEQQLFALLVSRAKTALR